MSDLLLQPLTDGESYDAILFGGDLVRDESLRMAVVVSLFTDAEDADLTTGERRGWWGDFLSTDPTDRIGSKLWLLARSKQTSAVLSAAKQYAQDALAWLLTDGVADSVTVTASYPAVGQLALDIEIDAPTGPQRFKFADIWAANFLDPMSVPDGIADDAASTAGRLAHIYYDPDQLPELA